MVKTPAAVTQRLEESIRVGMREQVNFEVSGGEGGGWQGGVDGDGGGGQWIDF